MKLINSIYILFFAFVLMSCGISKSLKDMPNLSTYNTQVDTFRQQINDSTFAIGANQLRKNKQGLYELYTKGDALERGLREGSLARELYQKQEQIFFSKVEEIVPSKTKQYLLRKFLAWFNRKMYLYIPNEYKTEIYGISKFAGNDYDYIADDYLRNLYLHGAHDIGHALKDLALVGCSSFAVWGNHTPDGKLLVARNFDFYAGDDFAKNKVISFVNPKQGYKFMSVTWGGMIGVVSGMNDQGLTVTINAGKSNIPLIAREPISLVTREILQYASTIEEAIEIAKNKKVFVAEAILVGSAKDNKAVSIELSPKKFGVYEVENTSELICSNHFNSEVYKDDKNNNTQKAESHSKYRYRKMEELIEKDQQIKPRKAVEILRNTEGLKGNKIGYGNEKALNQLLAHHGIVFKPTELKVWVSSNPYQLGEFVCYDLNKVFRKFESKDYQLVIQEEDLAIEKSPFLKTQAYKNYEEYRTLRHIILSKINTKQQIEDKTLNKFIALNPDFWEVYYWVGEYYFRHKMYAKAQENFEMCLTKEITTIPDQKMVKQKLKKAKRRR